MGRYDVTTRKGQSGHFTINGRDSYNEILGNVDGPGVSTVRVQISSGESVQISGISRVLCTPITSPPVTTHRAASLYAGTWTVGQDIGLGRYAATPGTGQSGNFIMLNEMVDEILGSADGLGDPFDRHRCNGGLGLISLLIGSYAVSRSLWGRLDRVRGPDQTAAHAFAP